MNNYGPFANFLISDFAEVLKSDWGRSSQIINLKVTFIGITFQQIQDKFGKIIYMNWINFILAIPNNR